MCRMMCYFGSQKISIPENYLRKFLKNCHFGNRKRQDWIGYHAMGWGISWLDERGNFRTKRYPNPIWHYNLKTIKKIESRFIAIHARFAFERDIHNVHPICIKYQGINFCMFHNGIFKDDSFYPLQDETLEIMRKKDEDDMDTRKYLLSVLDEYQQIDSLNSQSIENDEGNSEKNIINAIRSAFSRLKLFNSGNSFFYTPKNLFIISYHKKISPLLEKHTYVLNMNKMTQGN